MKALIIEDERPARDELRRLLAHHPEIELCGEASNADQALAFCLEQQPDLLFLDIEMPGKDGFTFLEELPPPHPHVIFTTAYDAHALRAFEVNALDYLLKPIHPKRLAVALEKLGAQEKSPEQPVASLQEATAQALQPDDRVFVRDGDRCWFVPVKTIRLLESVGNHTRLFFDDAKPLLHRSITSMEERLPATLFMRASRSQIINLEHIESIGPWFSGSLKVFLNGGHEIEFSRRQAQLFRERMSL